MKKLITIILVLIMMLPTIATSGDNGVVGCWAHYELSTAGTPSMYMLYLSSDNTCYYIIQSFKNDAAGIGRTYVGTWEMQPNGNVIAKTGDNTNTTLYFSPEYGAALDVRTNQMYINLSKFD